MHGLVWYQTVDHTIPAPGAEPDVVVTSKPAVVTAVRGKSLPVRNDKGEIQYNRDGTQRLAEPVETLCLTIFEVGGFSYVEDVPAWADWMWYSHNASSWRKFDQEAPKGRSLNKPKPDNVPTSGVGRPSVDEKLFGPRVPS